MSSDGSVTSWIQHVKSGEESAAQQLWERHFARLVQLCNQKLRHRPRPAADEEDVALSAFHTFCQGAQQGRFPQLHDRAELWRLLVLIAAHKAIDLLRRENSQRRGGGRVAGEAALCGGDSSSATPLLDRVIGREPTPEFAALIAEEYDRLIESLGDDSLRRVAQAKLEGYSNEEIAGQLGCSLRTVERKLWVIRKTLNAEARRP